MVTKLFVASAAIVLFGILSEVTAQYRYGGYGYGYNQHPHYQQPRPGYGGFGGYPQQPQQNNFQLPPGVTVQEAEWVCRNPKTGDMLIISEDDLPTGTGNNGQPQQPNNPSINTQPIFSQPPPSYPTQSPPPPSTEAPNTNGDGLIDIRALD